MMIRRSATTILSAILVLFGAFSAFADEPKWELAWSDEFNGTSINEKYWTKIDRGHADWNNYMSPDPTLYTVRTGNLILRGKVNPSPKKDPVPYITGGVWTKDKYSFLYGKIEIRAKMDCAQGVWPAIWLLPAKPNRKWPDDGEIDIVEHLNFDDIAYQTIHTKFTKSGAKGPNSASTGKINRNDYNVYGMVWTPDKIELYINGEKTLSYPRVPDAQSKGQWPFTEPFFILIDMQIEGSWVGKANPKQLPVEMRVDWVRVYRDANLKLPAKAKEKTSKAKAKK
ncbi:MAG: glycoside hydrolase family 16 protein [Opitutae bacterium]|nr:glycoside hydrolase family 16 protein [Opitutae bacterium]